MVKQILKYIGRYQLDKYPLFSDKSMYPAYTMKKS